MLGDRYGRLTVVRAERMGRGATWLCRCDCGATKIVLQCHLRSGHTQSCGCLQREVNVDRSTVHGHHPKRRGETRTYRVWCNAKSRCFNPNVKAYADYGGRGITMCDRWRDSFPAFLADMGEAPLGLQLERSDNDGNYEPGNCCWATVKQQAQNRRPRRKIDRAKTPAVVSAS